MLQDWSAVAVSQIGSTEKPRQTSYLNFAITALRSNEKARLRQITYVNKTPESINPAGRLSSLDEKVTEQCSKAKIAAIDFRREKTHE